MSIGMEDRTSLPKVNLTMLRKMFDQRRTKHQDKKTPCVRDYDITPAPDSLRCTIIKDDDDDAI